MICFCFLLFLMTFSQVNANTTFYASWKATVIRAYTFTKNSNKCAEINQVFNDGFVRFSECGHVGSYMSIRNDDEGRSIRLIPSKSGTLRFTLTATNETSAGLTCSCCIFRGINTSDIAYRKDIQPNTTVSFTADVVVSANQIINIGNNGRNAYMYVKSGSYIDWIS